MTDTSHDPEIQDTLRKLDEILKSGDDELVLLTTSAINALAKTGHAHTVTEGICVAYDMGITETVLSEIVADPDEARRKMLLDLLKRLLGCGKCVMPFHWTIEAHAKAYRENPTDYDWHKLDVRFRAAEDEIARQELTVAGKNWAISAG